MSARIPRVLAGLVHKAHTRGDIRGLPVVPSLMVVIQVGRSLKYKVSSQGVNTMKN
jgi:hypothetical protein